MNPRLRTTLVFIAASIAAVFLGWQVAEGSYAWPALATAAIAATIMVRFTGVPADAIFVGFLFIGYVVGNRGFAQLMPAPGLPILPAEAGLLIAVSWRTIVCAFGRETPFQRDFLNWMVLAWLVVGSVRVVFDVPHWGFLAVRDYAMTYYAVFFFLAQHMARDRRTQRFLTNCVLAAFLLLVPVYVLFQFFPLFFLTQLTITGVPLVYYKGDLAVTFLAMGSLLLFHWAKGNQRFWVWPLCVTMFLYVLSGDNRASLLAACVASALLLLARRWRFPALQGAMTVVALMVVIALAVLFDNTWANRKLDGLGDRLHSITDISGSGTYQSEESYFKGDNNRFRLVWWKNVTLETWATNPVFGLGFGTDLARGFVQEYYPDATEEFNTRSPHNIFVTSFGRMGFLGVVVWAVLCVALIKKSWRALRRAEDPLVWSLWCGACMLLCTATFGVVLEGPMGAVVFWTLLGLANSFSTASEPKSRSAAGLNRASAEPIVETAEATSSSR